MTARFSILTAIDDTEYAEVVLEHALDQAARHEATDLHVLRVVEGRDVDLEHERRWLQQAIVDALTDFGGSRDGLRTRIHVRYGKTADEIVDLAGEIDASLLVIGRFGMHGRRSIADRVLQNVSCPTLVVGSLGREAETEPRCPSCVAVRAESDGASWFCAEHAAPGRLRLSTLVPPIVASRGSIY